MLALHELTFKSISLGWSTELLWPRWQRLTFKAITLGLHFMWPVAFECLGEATLLTRQGLLLTAPLLVPLGLLLLSSLIWATKGLRRCLPDWGCLLIIRNAEVNVHLMVNIIGVIASMVVVPYTSWAFGFFHCFEHEWSGPAQKRVASVWRMPDVLCWQDEWFSALPLAIFSLGYPLAWLALQIYVIRHLPMMMVPSPGWGKPDEGLITRHQHIFARYRVKMHLWEVCGLLRCFLIQISLSLPLESSGVWYKFYIILAVSLLMLLPLTLYLPHTELSVNLLEGALTCAMTMFVMTGLSISRSTDHASIKKTHSQNAIAGAVIITLLFTAYIFMMATRDLLFPASAARRKANSSAKSVLLLQQISSAASNAATHLLISMAAALDQRSARRVMHSLQLMEQLISPASERKTIQWTRLNAFEFFTQSIDQEFDQTFQRHGSVQSISLRSSSGALQGIVAMVAENSLTSEQMSIRSSKRTRASIRSSTTSKSEGVAPKTLGRESGSEEMPTLLRTESPKPASPAPEATCEDPVDVMAGEQFDSEGAEIERVEI